MKKLLLILLFMPILSFGLETVPANNWVKLINAGDTAIVKPIKSRDVILWVMSVNEPTVKCSHAEQATKKDSPSWSSAPADIWFCSTSGDIQVFVNKSTDTVAN